LRVEETHTTIEIENDEGHAAQHKSPLADDTMIDIRNTEEREIVLEIEEEATDRQGKVLFKSAERATGHYHHKKRPSKRIKALYRHKPRRSEKTRIHHLL
jgi:hypothetical protein